MKEALLFTAGIDSYIAREYLIEHGHDIDCVYFDHQGRYCNVEKEYIKKLNFPVKIVDNLKLSDIEQDSAFIPNRNILLTVMANSLGYQKIWIGGSKSDRVCDNNQKVFDELSTFLSNMTQSFIKIDSPFWDCYKEDMLSWFMINREMKSNPNKAGYQYITEACHELLSSTFSCFTPLADYQDRVVDINGMSYMYHTKECMKCSACFRKTAVLYSCSIRCNFLNPVIVAKYEKEFRNSLISTPRTENTLNYIIWWKSKNQKS